MITETVKGKKRVKRNIVFNPKYIGEYVCALLEEGNFSVIDYRENGVSISMGADLDGLSIEIGIESQFVSVLSCESIVITSGIYLVLGKKSALIKAQYSQGDFSLFFTRLGDHLFDCGRALFNDVAIDALHIHEEDIESEWYITTKTETI